MIKIYFSSVKDQNFLEINDYRPGSWIHVSEATLEDLKEVQKITGLEIYDLQDSLDKYEVPRIEVKENNIIIFVRHPVEEESDPKTFTFAIILTKQHVITITPHSSNFIETILKSRLSTTQKSNFLFHILLRITQSFTNEIKKIRIGVKELTNKKDISNNTIIALTKCEDSLNQYLAALVPMRNVLEAIMSGRYVNLFEKDRDLLQDLSIALKQSEDICKVDIKSIRSLRDSYQILFTNDVNKSIKILTGITLIFMIPSIIASTYGMNVSLPFSKNAHAFLIIMIMMGILSLAVFYLLIRKKWL